MNPYESDRLLNEYLLFHYGQAEEVLPYSFGPVGALNFAVRVVEQCVDPARLPENARALDLGCAVGRSSFELARHCTEVLGIDYSHRFVQAAEALCRDGQHAYERADEGDLRAPLTALAPSDVDRARVRFEAGDACDLPDSLGTFDVALLVNLVDRLPDPRRCLARLPDLLRPGGQLVIASPYTWLEEYTPRENWLGGFEHGGKPVTGFGTLCEILVPGFELVCSVDLPFLIREHARKFQWSVSRAGVWIRK